MKNERFLVPQKSGDQKGDCVSFVQENAKNHCSGTADQRSRHLYSFTHRLGNFHTNPLRTAIVIDVRCFTHPTLNYRTLFFVSIAFVNRHFEITFETLSITVHIHIV